MQETTASEVAGTFRDLGLSTEVVALLEKGGITSPFPIQQRVIPHALAGRDVFGQAQTGSGKTLAFALPIVEAARRASKLPFALVMVPTRELAAQVAEEFEKVGGGTRVMSAYGGTPVNKDVARLERGIDVLVATPGRLADLYERGALVLDEVAVLVLDEADRMLDLGFMYDMDWLIRRLPAERQTMLFSATLGPTVRQLARRYTRDPIHVEVETKDVVIEDCEHRFFEVYPMDKLQVLLNLLRPGSRTIVFTSTKRFAARLEQDLMGAGVKVAALHGDMRQSARSAALARFRSGKVDALVASDVAARGLDVVGIDQVINYDPPDDPTVYLHRTGRTARAGAPGLAVTLCTAQQRGHVEHMLKRLGLDLPVEQVFSNSEVLKELAS